MDSRCLLSGYNVTLNSQYEAGTSIAGQSQPYSDIADFQATDPNGNPVATSTGFTATIIWGDGTTSAGSIQRYAGVQGLFEVNGSHAYPNPSNGEYDVEVELIDPDGGVWYSSPSIATVDPPSDYFGSNSGNGTTGSTPPSEPVYPPPANAGNPGGAATGDAFPRKDKPKLIIPGLGHPTQADLNFAYRHPGAAAVAFSDAQKAATFGQGFAGYSSDGPGDAARHAYWSALMTRDIGARLAAMEGQNHEDSSDDSKAEKEMDLYNNSVGRTIGLQNPGATDSALQSAVADALFAGELKYSDRK